MIELRRAKILIVIVLLSLAVQACAGRRAAEGNPPVAGNDAAATAGASATATATVVPQPATFTPVPTVTKTPTPGPTPTPTDTVPPPSSTPAPTATPTSAPQVANSLPNVGMPASLLTATPPTAVPTAVPTFAIADSVTNVLLLGNDDPKGVGLGRSDTIIIASVDRATKTAAMVSLPRDLYVFIPTVGMGRINTALTNGSVGSYPGGGVGLLQDTILYNFGVPIHYYARIDFEGFQTVVDALGGVDIAISCAFEDFRLKSPDLDPEVEENWELFRVDPGIHHMDGETALWYARSRDNREADWGRIKRQQQLLGAIFNQGVDLNLLPQVPTLYNTYKDTVDTNLDIGRILQLAAAAPGVRENGIQHLYVSGNQVQSWAVPGSDPPAYVQLPQWDTIQQTFNSMFSPPALNSGSRAPIFVEVINGTDNPDLALLAADNLAWYGFVPVIGAAERQDYESTSISYYGANLKGAFDNLLSWIFGLHSGDVELRPDTPNEYDYRVVLGADYDPCVNQLFAPKN